MNNVTEQTPNFDMNALFGTTKNLNDMSNMGHMIGNMVGNMVNGGPPQQQYSDPNSRLMNQNPYATMNPYQQNPYFQQQPYQSTNYGYGYGDDSMMGMYQNPCYQNGMYPGISNVNYGM